jgi:hypothetical protein
MPVQEKSARRLASSTFHRLAVAAGLMFACLLLPVSAGAADPTANIPLGSMPAACAQEGSLECETWLLARLDGARATLGLSAYEVPSDFLALSPERQIFILADLDRTAYGYTPISGLNTALDEAAAAGVREGTDPLPPATEAPWRGFGSDWASTGPLLAYYLWMYDDGYPGPNLDCPSPGASGCWGHRHVILGEGLPLPQPEVLGVASDDGVGQSGTALIVSSHAGAATYYTWAQAQSEGAGTGTGTGEKSEPPPREVPGGGSGGIEKSEPPPSGSPGGGTGEKSEPPPSPPPTTCSGVAGAGAMHVPGLRGHVSDRLSTLLSRRKESFEARIRYPRVGVVRVRSLAEGTCVVTDAGREFRGQGLATVNGVGGYAASFTVFVGPSGSTFSLELTKGSALRLRVSGIPLRGSSETVS